MNLVRRFVGLFVLLFIPTAALDVWTTELARQRPNTVELNPMGFLPLRESILTEIPLLLLGAGLVALGAWLRRATLLQAGTLRFRDFATEFLLRGSYLAALVFFAPLAVAALRFTAITNNLMYLTVGWSVWDRWLLYPIVAATHLPVFKAYIIMSFILALLGLGPITWLIYRVAKHRPHPQREDN